MVLFQWLLHGFMKAKAEAIFGSEKHKLNKVNDYFHKRFDPEILFQGFEKQFNLPVHIPAEVGHPFRAKPATYSGRSRPPVPVYPGHPFRMKTATWPFHFDSLFPSRHIKILTCSSGTKSDYSRRNDYAHAEDHHEQDPRNYPTRPRLQSQPEGHFTCSFCLSLSCR